MAELGKEVQNYYAPDTLFVLGAGASAADGAPVMSNFLDKARDIYVSQMPGLDREAFSTLFTALTMLRRVQSYAEVDLRNIEVVLSLLELAHLTWGHSQFNEFNTKSAITALRRVIVQTLDYTLRYSRKDDIIAPPYNSKRLVDRCAVHLPKKQIAFISFNYDVALEYSLDSCNISYDYCLNDGFSKSSVPVVKLHGSVNWSKCESCARIGFVPIAEADLSSLQMDARTTTDYVHLKASSSLNKLPPCCGYEEFNDPLIVPPSYNKFEYFKIVNQLWKTAVELFQRANQIVVIGYSLPPSDFFFRNLYALGMINNEWLKKFVVINPDEQILGRFEEMMGPMARNAYIPLAKTLEDSFPEIEDVLADQPIGTSRKRYESAARMREKISQVIGKSL